MKYMERAKIYKASNVTYNPLTFDARSYSWWRFVKPMGNLVVFNNYRYSPSTGKHQSKVQRLLESLGVKIDVFVEVPCGLHNSYWPRDAIALLQVRNAALSEEIAKPRTHKAKNAERREAIHANKVKIKEIQKLAKLKGALL